MKLLPLLLAAATLSACAATSWIGCGTWESQCVKECRDNREATRDADGTYVSCESLCEERAGKACRK